MSEVTLQVGGRPYTVSCADGEEDHVRHLAEIIDTKLASLGGNLAPGEAKNLLFASLLLADEVDEIRRAKSSAPSPEANEPMIRGLEMLADRLESVAEALESGAGNA